MMEILSYSNITRISSIKGITNNNKTFNKLSAKFCIDLEFGSLNSGLKLLRKINKLSMYFKNVS